MKICTALACLENNALNPGEEIYCQGSMARVGDKKILRDHAEPGSYDLPHAIQVSSNVRFATIAHRLGGEKLAALAELFGLGTRTRSTSIAGHYLIARQHRRMEMKPATNEYPTKAESRL
jgi:cell division protein FtsI/penicillin-binding protein 2